MENSVNPNPYLVEKTIQREIVTTTVVEETITAIDWSKVPNGTYMTADVDGISCEGVVWNDGGREKFFCQNRKDGSRAPFLFGFSGSWSFSQKSDGTHGDITNIQFPPKPEDLVLPVVPPTPISVTVGDGGYTAQVVSENVLTVGCQTITKEQIVNVLAVMEGIGK